MKTYTLTARPTASIKARPYEAELIKGASVTVELRCNEMGRNNRLKILRLVMPELLRQFGQLCKLGGYTCGEPTLKAGPKKKQVIPQGVIRKTQ